MGITVLTGCTSVVGGVAARQDSTGPLRDLTTVLPSSAEVGQAVGNPLVDNEIPAVGGIEMLPNGIRDNTGADPIECIGAVTPFMRVIYETGDVRGVAWQEFSNFGGGQMVSSVDAGVVQFSSEAEAQRMFGAFVARWKTCEGKTVRSTVRSSSATTELYQKVTDVTVDGPVLSATVITSDNQGDVAFPIERAIGLAADSVVDVDAAVTGGQHRVSGRAVTLAGTMRDKVSRGR